jgi:hypothetical protein
MFGASEDRARQLAGRQRWKRISSNDSNSSHRSASSLSQLSQLSQSEASSILEQKLLWPFTNSECDAVTFHDCLQDEAFTSRPREQFPVASDAEEALPHMMATNQHLRTQQQRQQAEHLSQVLYNDMAVENQRLPSPVSSVLPSQLKHYGVLGWGAKILHQVRHATAPALQTQVQEDQSNTTAVLGITTRSTSAYSASVQTAASLRGGANNTVEDIWYAAMRNPYRYLSFNTGNLYRQFVDHLPEEKYLLFKELFGNSRDLHQRNNLARQVFFRNLERSERVGYVQTLGERAGLLNSSPYQSVRTQRELDDLAGMSRDEDLYPLVDLVRLGIGIQPMTNPHGFR